MKKRLISMLLVGTMLGTMLTGCGSSGTAKDAAADAGKQEGTEAGKSESKEGEPLELTFYMQNSPVKDQERIMEKANKIVEEKIGATVKFVMIDPSNYAQKMNLMINSGDPWDLCFTASWGGINFYENAQKGAYADLTELMPKLAPETYARIPEGLWDGVKVDGKIYASVNYQQWGAAARSGFKFRKDIADEVGFDWQSVKGKPSLEALKMTGDFIGKAIEKHPDMIGWETSSIESFYANNPLYWNMEEVGDVTIPGWVNYDDSKKVVNQFETEEFMEFCKIMRDWYDKGYVRKDGATVKDTSTDKKAGKYIAEKTTGWPDTVDFEGNADMKKMSMGTEETTPAVGVSTTRTVIKAGAGPTAAVAVNSQSPNIEKAVEFIELLNTDDELYLLITQGEEGVDYEYAEDGTYSLIEGKYNFNYNEWQIGQSFSEDFTRALYNKNEAGDKQKESQSMVYAQDKEAEVSPLTGFVFDTSPVKSQIANCSSIITEMIPALSSGSVDPETKVPEFLERLKAAGVDEIIAEKQTQLDAWNAAK